MENVDIKGLGDIKVVTDLFSQVGCNEDDNCIVIVTNRDFGTGSYAGDIMTTNSTVAGAKAGGVVGGLVAGAVAGAVNAAVQEKVGEFHRSLDYKKQIAFDTRNYAGFLVNVVSNGIGVIPLKNSGQLIPKIKDLKTDADNFVFFENDEIETKALKKLPLHFSSVKLAICFKGTGELKVDTPWECPKKHKLIPYQEENFNKLAAKLAK
ncbi:MAG: hypothetical protein J6I66_06165 [Lachnospiraceae bacterium]|nr:hypothetical protein [Lachnospiraceae bacterium]